MPEANSIAIPSKAATQCPRVVPKPAQKPKLLNRLRKALRSRYYSRRTEQSYCHWVKRFILFHNKRHPADMAEAGRHYLDESLVQKAVRDAIARAGSTKRATCHTFRHSFATHRPEGGYEIRTVQELFGHEDVKTTMIYTHVLNRGGRVVRSPMDAL